MQTVRSNVDAGNGLGELIDCHVSLTPRAKLSRKRNIGKRVLDHVSILVDVGDPELHGTAILGSDQTVGPGALPGDVQIHNFLLVVLHFLLLISKQKRVSPYDHSIPVVLCSA